MVSAIISIEYDVTTLKKRFHESNEKKRGSLPINRPKLSTAEEEMLSDAISPDVEKLRQFSGLKFSNWSL
jgi:hypothetical protein